MHLQSNSEKHFRSPFRWLLLGNIYNSTGDERSFIPKAIEGIEILVDSDVILAQPLDDRSYELHLSEFNAYLKKVKKSFR